MNVNLPVQDLDPFRMGMNSGSNQAFTPTFHPPSRMGHTSAMDKLRFSTPGLRDAKAEMELMIGNTVRELTITKNQEFLLKRVVPIVPTDEINLSLKIRKAHPGYMSITPERAIGQVLEQSVERQYVSLIRYSVLLEDLHAYMDSVEGSQAFRLTLRQAQNAVVDTARMQCYQELRRVSDPQQEWLQRHGDITHEQLEEYLEWDRWIFGALQKYPHALEKIDGLVTNIMTSYDAYGDTFIMSERLQLYATLGRREKTSYQEGGQEAVDRVNGKPNGYENGSTNTGFDRIDPVYYVRKNRVEIARFTNVEGMDKIDPFRRQRGIGTWNIIEDNFPEMIDYSSRSQTRQIFNMEKDDFDEIDLDYCVDNQAVISDQGLVVPDGYDAPDELSDLGRQEDPFSYITPGANQATQARYFGEIHPKYLGLAWFKKVLKANVTYEAVTENNIFVNQGNNDAPVQFRIGSRLNRDQTRQTFVANVMPARSLDAGQMFLDLLIGCTEDTQLRKSLDAIVADTGSVMEKAASIKTELKRNYRAAGFENENAALEFWQSSMNDYQEALQAGIGASSFSVPQLEEVPFFAKMFKAQQQVDAGIGGADDGNLSIGGFHWGEGGPQAVHQRGQAAKEGNFAGQLGNKVTNASSWEAWFKNMELSQGLDQNSYKKVLAILGEPINKESLKRFIRLDIPHPFNYLICRPFCTFETDTIFKLAANGQAGFTYFGNTRVEVGHDVHQNLQTMNISVYMKTFFHEPKNVFLINDVYVHRYVKGMNIVPFSPQSYQQQHRMGHDNRSVFVVVLPAAEKSGGRNSIDNRISMTGRWPTRYEQRNNPNKFGHYTTWFRHDLLFGWTEMLEGTNKDMPAMANPEHINMIMWKGRQNIYNKTVMKWVKEWGNRGHLGYTYPGCAQVWNGSLTQLAEHGTME